MFCPCNDDSRGTSVHYICRTFMPYVYYLSIMDIIYKHLFFPSSGNRHFPSTILNSHDYPVASKSIVINSKLLESKVLFSFIIQHPCTNSLMADIGFPIGSDALYKRYKIDADGFCGKMYISYYTVYLFETCQSWRLIDILGVIRLQICWEACLATVQWRF